MQLVCCVCEKYRLRGANMWTNRGVLGSFCQINTWTAAKSGGDNKHSSFIDIRKCIQLLFLCVRACVRACVCVCVVHRVSAVLQCARKRVACTVFLMADWCHSWATQAFARVSFWWHQSLRHPDIQTPPIKSLVRSHGERHDCCKCEWRWKLFLFLVLSRKIMHDS